LQWNHYCVSKKEVGVYEQISNSCIVVIGKAESGGKYVCSGNLVQNIDVDKLKRVINEVNGLDKQELKKLYKQKLKQDIALTSKSAGLGIVDIARKSSSPLEFSLENIDELYSFFTLKATV